MKSYGNNLGIAALLLAVSASSASASVIAVGPAAFPTSSALITFTGLPDGTEVNGLSVGGVLFTYSLGNGNVLIDGGPGVTNNIDPPNVVSTGDDTGTLTMTLPSPATMFGYGYAILSVADVVNATTISLFSGTTNVGTLSYDGAPDPVFTGGFAGIQSTLPFDKVAVTFNSVEAPAFALDNIRISAAVPEPSTSVLLLVGSIVAGLYCAYRKLIASA
jgi:hypothetical protein